MVDIKIVVQKIEDNKELLKELKISQTKIDKILDKLNASDSLCTFLDIPIYTFTYTAESFLEKIFMLYHIDGFDEIIKKYQNYRQELSKFQGSYIFVNTNFRRKNEPIIALALMEYRRIIKLDPKKLIFKDDDKIINYISSIIKDHYTKTDGKLPLWGKIENYFAHYNNKEIVFDKNGNIVKNIEIIEQRASITI